ncbi:MAG: hypothetical protein KDK91_02355 [Gammaproteobacteria bacterium]|nr:hypothetical protein [Gammaproteobacteria bacterium]
MLLARRARRRGDIDHQGNGGYRGFRGHWGYWLPVAICIAAIALNLQRMNGSSAAVARAETVSALSARMQLLVQRISWNAGGFRYGEGDPELARALSRSTAALLDELGLKKRLLGELLSPANDTPRALAASWPAAHLDSALAGFDRRARRLSDLHRGAQQGAASGGPLDHEVERLREVARNELDGGLYELQLWSTRARDQARAEQDRLRRHALIPYLGLLTVFALAALGTWRRGAACSGRALGLKQVSGDHHRTVEQ